MLRKLMKWVRKRDGKLTIDYLGGRTRIALTVKSRRIETEGRTWTKKQIKEEVKRMMKEHG